MKPTTILAALTSLLLGGAPAAAAHPENWRAVADKLLRTPAETWAFNWGEGVQMIGMMKIHERTGDQRYADYVEQWAGFHLTKDVKELLNLPPTNRWGPGYCGHWSPATAILYLHLTRKKAEHLRPAEQIADFVRSGAERAPDGGLGHWLGNHQLWVDTLYMACPLLSRLGMLVGRKDYVEDAANQIVVQARRLQDPKTGLFYHMWDWDQNTMSPDFWGRGNGWVLMSLADTMEALGRKQPLYKALKRIAEKQARGIKALQDGDGMWHTVLDDAGSYQESSATCMFVYGLLKLARLGVLPKAYVPIAGQGWTAVNNLYVKDGEVTGASAGTSPKGGDHYRSRSRGTQTWGTGAYLMAGSEIDRLQ